MPEHRDELPKIAEARLRQQASPAGLHPDANVLTAFVEGGLSDAERSTALAHLATCADCREIVALSLPEQDPAILKANAGNAGWNWTRMLQWGAVAASVVVVASAVLSLNTWQSKSAEMIETVSRETSERAKETQAPPALPSTSPDISIATKQEERKESDKPKAPGSPKRMEKAASKAAPVFQPEPPTVAGPLKDSAGRYGKTDYFSGGSAPASVGANAPTYHGEALQLNAKTPETGAGAADNASNNRGFVGGGLAQQGRVLQSPSVRSAAPSEQTKTATEANAEVVARPAAPPPAFAKSRVKAEDAKSADKIPSASETVEVTGQAAAIDSSAAAQDSFRSLPTRYVNETAAWMIDRNGKLFTRRDSKGWKEVAVPDNPHLVALVVKSNDIWVGGTKAALYHSADAGNSWTFIKGGWPPNSDIVQLVFTDPEHLALQTAQGERWATADGGKSWSKK